jgi:uridine kinase
MYVVAVTGGSGAGKSFVCKKIINAIGMENICHLSQDHYYLPRHLQPYDDNGIQNFDTLASIDLQSFCSDILKLQAGNTIYKQEYVYNNPNKLATEIVFRPAAVLVLEGLLLLHHPTMYQWIDLKVFVDAPENLKLQRRIQRDAIERGYDSKDVIYRFQHHVTPMYEYYIAPYKLISDVVIDNNGGDIDSDVAKVVEIVKNQISK